MPTYITEQIELNNIDIDSSSLRLKGNGIKDFSILLKLNNLTELELLSTKHFDISIIEKLTKLTSLRLNGILTITDLTFLKPLTNLTKLTLETPVGWDGSGKTIKCNSLSPLRFCNKLNHITILDIMFANDGLNPLFEIKSLTEIVTRNTFTTYDFAKLELHRPDIICDHAGPYIQHTIEFYKCKKCGDYKIEFSGIDLKRRVFCKNCNRQKVVDLTRRYYEIQKTSEKTYR